MSVQKVSVMVPSLRSAPPGALVLADAVSWLFGGNSQIRTGLPGWIAAVRGRFESGQRAARQRARSREGLLALARRYEATQPEFAKDLFAAASNERGV